MLKTMEEAFKNSCWNKCRPTEMTFILIGRDAAAPAAIRAWIGERIRLGLNKPNDPQIKEAEIDILGFAQPKE